MIRHSLESYLNLAELALRSDLSKKDDWNNPRIPLNARIVPKEGSIEVEVEVPGVEPSEVEVRVEGRSLSISTPRGFSHFTIGQRIDPDNAEAELKNGLLRVTIPKREAKVVHIKVA
jgi:HSP20 family molecular chaperone IbpA